MAQNAAGETQVLKWKDGKKAVFMLAFDDSAPSQLQNVVPELRSVKSSGIFICDRQWPVCGAKKTLGRGGQSPHVAVANHTFTHKGVNNAEELEPELAKCSEVLYKMHPELKQPHLLGFACQVEFLESHPEEQKPLWRSNT